ncbi:hypothetical protein NDU88_006950 [Pleurodeles waltl]|uniref:Uncharacterized protein n=1 Tax=Pleurodeles waltl TaxID=8319 RepID=A0AAV7N0Q0_PLEWA|nr:hypothetical protein NDU88_006950 [Pleurodeles waltl]
MTVPPMTNPPETVQSLTSDIFMERILQEITAVGRRLEGKDTKISDLTAESRSIRNDIASFQGRMTNIDHSLSIDEEKLNFSPYTDHELQYLRDKITDLEDWGHRNNVGFFGIPERVKGMDVKAILINNITTITGLTYSPAGVTEGTSPRPDVQRPGGQTRPVIACFHRHEQARQLLTAPRTHGPYLYENRKLKMVPDFSQDINERRGAFLALPPPNTPIGHQVCSV